jgi:major membrane immunogen (membrane-anchored lipoprotein)
MKRVVLMIICAMICGVILSSCGKVTEVSELEGTYDGTYTWTFNNGSPLSSTPTIELREGKYTYQGLSRGSYFDSGNGNFTINGNKIIFELTYYNIPMEDIGVNQNWLLQGEYKYKFDDNKLTFSKNVTNTDGKFKYVFELKRNK